MPEPENSRPEIEQPSQELDAISTRLVAARAGAEALPNFPGRLPESLDDAYVVQAASIARWPDEIVGWKVGMVPGPYREKLATDRVAGPVFKTSVFGIEHGSTRTMPIYSGGFAALEAEFVFELKTAIEPLQRDYSDDDLIDLVSAMHIGAEIASSPMAMVNELGPCCVACDFGNNEGLLVGPSIPDWSSQPLDSMTAAVTIDGDIVGTASAKAIEGGPLQAMRFLLESSAKRGVTLPAGTLISTGAVTGIHDVDTDSKAKVDFGALGSFNVEFEPMTRRQ